MEWSRRMKRRRIRKRGAPAPDPILVPISGEFAGNDGPWSTFGVRIGNPPQFLRMLASTSSPEMWVVSPNGCGAEDGKDCPTDRGQLFNKGASSSWKELSNGTTHNLDRHRGLPIEGTGVFGTDTLQLSTRQTGPEGSAIIIPEQTIAQVATKDIYLGMLGLSPRPLTMDKGRTTRTGNLVDMKARGLIPSQAYGYTAGAKYRRQGSAYGPAHTSLVLGGYDSSMFKANDVEFRMANGARDLSLWVKNVSYTTNSSDSAVSVPLSTKPFNAVIDTATSLYWLPKELCDIMAETFHLKYNSTMGLYLISEPLHDQLTQLNPTISFTLSNDPVSGKSVSLSLPYDAFELKMTREYGPAHAWSRFFPIREATNESQITLGRAFLQEAYLIANYETRNFSVHQRTWDADRPSITSIKDPNRPGGDETSTAATYGLIAGGCALAGLLILLLAWRCGRRRKRRDIESNEDGTPKTELDSTSRTIYELDKGNEVYELSGKPERVEAINPDMKCAYDDEVAANAASGPFELPSNEVVERFEYAPGEPSSSSSNAPLMPPPPPPAHIMEDELISPIEGTYMGTFTQAISPITPTEPSLDTVLEAANRQNLEKQKEKEKEKEKT